MTENTEHLIAEAREWPRDGVNEGWLINALADALEAATEWARQAEAELRDVLRVDIPSLKAERDAALAAIERVREIVSDPCSEGCCDFCEGKNEGWEMVLQALDGAPEPEEKS